MAETIKTQSDYITKMARDIVSKQEEILMPDQDGNKTHDVKDGNDFTKNFTMKPKELESYLNDFVIDQPNAVRTLATEICTHYNSIRNMKESGENPMDIIDQIKPNIIALGPTGSGKTYLLKLIANKLGVPFVKGDATKFSETGYVGGDVEDLVRDLLKETDDDIEKAQFGIVYINEIDKIAERKKNGYSDHVSRSGVQRGLLKIMEESDVDLNVKMDLTSQVSALEDYKRTGITKPTKINTKNILFVLSGTFSELEEQMKEKIKGHGTPGFGGSVVSKDNIKVDLKEVEENPRELIEYGFEAEFIGRTPIITTFNKLTQEGLVKILNNPKSSIIQKVKRDFKGYGIDVSFENNALEYFAEKAIELGTGARGLVTVIYRAIRDYKTELPEAGITMFKFSKNNIEDGFDKIGLTKEIAFQAGLKGYTGRLKKEFGINAELEPGLSDKVYKMSVEANMTPYKLCEDSFSNLEKELKTIQGFYNDSMPSSYLRSIILTKEMLSDPEAQNNALAEITKNATCDAYSKKIKSEISVDITFNDEAKDKIYIAAEKASITPYEFCNRAFNEMKEGFKLLKNQKDDLMVTLTALAVNDPKKYINGLFKDIYG